MKELYTQEWLERAKKQSVREWTAFGIVCALALAGMIVGIALRIQWLALVAPAVGAVVAVFLYGMKCAPVYKYMRYLRDVRTGIRREADGVFLRFGAEKTLRDGVWFWPLEYTSDGEERIAYWDANLEKAQFAEGQELHFLHSGNSVQAMRA